MAIQGKVAAILNERELIINRGTASGVKEKMVFSVAPREEEVKDPDTGEILVSIPREKIRVKVSEVKEKMSVARTYETFQVYEAPDPFVTLRMRRGQVTKVRTLRDETDFSGPFKPDRSFVNVGDPVMEVHDAI